MRLITLVKLRSKISPSSENHSHLENDQYNREGTKVPFLFCVLFFFSFSFFLINKDMNTKTCRRCNHEKPIAEFYKNNAMPDKLTIYCKECSKERERTYYHKHSEKRKVGFKIRNLQRRNGEKITSDEYKALVENQKNCGICKQFLTNPYIDHDHVTGKVRMLLCHHCNTLLGMAKDNTDILKNAIEYLNKFR